MDIASIPDLTLAECLQLVESHFDTQTLSSGTIDEASVLDYYRQSDRGYRLFHSQEGAMHVALNCDETFTTAGYMGQVDLVAERAVRSGAQRVLEIGCGVGYNARHLATRLPEGQVVGLDLSEAHVASARREAKQVANVEFQVGNFQQLPFDEASFDLVFAVECLCQATDMAAAVREAARVLRPGGRLIVIDCFRGGELDTCDDQLRLAVQLVEKTMAVDRFAHLDQWLQLSTSLGFSLSEQLDLSGQISHNISRFYSLSRRFFRMPRAARAFLKAFPPRLLENSISGLLMPFTVGSGVHQYLLVELVKD